MTDSNSKTGLVLANHGHYATVEDAQLNQYRCTFRRKLGMVVAGDKVEWQQTDKNGGDITKLLPRHSAFTRLDRRKQEKILASNINHIVIVNAVFPEPDSLLIDSYIAAARMMDCDVTLLFNKYDRVSELDNPNDYQAFIKTYKTLGYKTLTLSCKFDESDESLRQIFNQRCSILVGQSGVGKSSLTNKLIPDLALRTQEISENTLKGTHTTTNATLYHLDNSDLSAGEIIDSPGVREFRFQPQTKKDIVFGFKEFLNYSDQCQFNDCQHISDKGCSVISAVQNGKIIKSRWDNYVRLYQDYVSSQTIN